MFTCEMSLNCILVMAHFCTLLFIFKKTFYLEINIDAQVSIQKMEIICLLYPASLKVNMLHNYIRIPKARH